jgi:transposase
VEGIFLGVDFHARTQTVSWCDTANGIIERRTLDHRTDDVRAFYQQFHVPAVLGLEATGYARWFHRLVEETGHQLLIGDARRIRQFAARRQKNDRRDSELLLDLLLLSRFCPYTTIGFPPIKQPLALEAAALAFGCPRKMGQKKETFSCPA